MPVAHSLDVRYWRYSRWPQRQTIEDPIFASIGDDIAMMNALGVKVGFNQFVNISSQFTFCFCLFILLKPLGRRRRRRS
jgi:hypothetical protein